MPSWDALFRPVSVPRRNEDSDLEDETPAPAFAPSNLDTEQRIFIAHSRRDPILPAENTRQMVKGLESAGFAPEVHWFNGGHEIDLELKKAAFDFALAQ